MRESQLRGTGRGAVRHGLTRGALLSLAFALAAGLVLRLWMLKSLFDVEVDSLVYGGIAKNLLLHGRYAFEGAHGVLSPTLIRLPGYPLFLAACFRLFGMENYWAACLVEIALELAGCLLLADFARRAARMVRGADEKFARRAGLATLWTAVLCPFTASYTAAAMTEAPTLFALAVAIWAMARFRSQPGWPSALIFTFAVTWAALLRPEGALAAIAFVPVLLMALRGDPRSAGLSRIFLVCTLLALAPFAAWTWRNWQVFHVLEPLAPRLAIEPDERPNLGWESWIKSWCLDFSCTYDIYWNVPGGPIDLADLPARAFDSPAQYAETASIFHDYNTGGKQLTPQLDARFSKLARERIATHPLRYYVWLPLGRVADMWLRPRIENLPIDLDWQVYAHHNDETIFSWLYAGLNALYILLAAIGLWLRPRFWKVLLAYIVLRSAMLLSVQAPEARYTLECFPVLFVLVGIAMAYGIRKLSRVRPLPVPPVPAP